LKRVSKDEAIAGASWFETRRERDAPHHEGYRIVQSSLVQEIQRLQPPAIVFAAFADHELIRDLAEYPDLPDLSRASATCMRNIRLKFLGATLKFVSAHPELPGSWITLSHPDWYLGKYDNYGETSEFDAPQVLRSLLRIGGVMSAPGYLIMYVDALFDPTTEYFKLQFSGISGGEKLKLFGELRKTINDDRNAPLVRDYIGPYPSTHKFKTTLHTISDLPTQVSGMMPNQLTARFGGLGNSVKIRRVPEPHHSIYLVWAHLYRMRAMVVMSGVRIHDGQFVLVNER